MLELRPLWGLIVLLNFCVIIWRITELQPNIYETQRAGTGGGGVGGGGIGGNVNFNNLTVTETYKHFLQQQPEQQQQLPTPKYQQQHKRPHQHLSQGKHSLSNDAQSGQNTTEIKRIETNFIHTNYNLIDLSNPLGSLNATQATLASLDSAQQLDNIVNPAAGTSTAAPVFSFAPGDFEQLIDLRNFSYLMTQPSCHHRIEALILVHSAPHNYVKRQQIRRTWGGDILVGSPLRCLFLLGAVNETSLQEQLERENDIYKDMVQGTFVDAYRNMTYKHVMAFKWFLYNCAQAQILIKVDDDILVNTPLLLKLLSNARLNNAPNTTLSEINAQHTPIARNYTANSTFLTDLYNYFAKPIDPGASLDELSHLLFQQPQNLLFCKRLNDARVMRSYRSKWRVAFKEYKGRYYPPYCPGFAIIYSPDVVFRLYNAAQESPYFWIDDVHITGLMSQRMNITITTSQPYVASGSIAEKPNNLQQSQFLFTLDGIKPNQQDVIWQLIVEANKQNSSEEDTKSPTPMTQLSNSLDYKKLKTSTSFASNESFR